MEACVRDLDKHGHLIRIKTEVDPNLEMAEIHRRVFDAQGKEVASKLNVQGQVVSLDLKHLNEGVYYLQIQMDGQMYQEKLIK